MHSDLLTRFWTDLAGRLTGSLTFRLIPPADDIDPVRDSRRDRHAGRDHGSRLSVHGLSGDSAARADRRRVPAGVRAVFVGARPDRPAGGAIHSTQTCGGATRVTTLRRGTYII